MVRARGVAALVVLASVTRARADDATLNGLLRRADAVAHEVARVRGLPLKHPVPNDVVGRDELRARLLADLAKDKSAAELAAEGFASERWGLIPPGTDYQGLLVDLLTEQIAGYYDSDTKKLTISRSAGDDKAWAEMVLAHELDHALQDQAYDLHRFEDLPDDEGDASLARHALVEGDGIALMLEVVAARAGDSINWADSKIPAMIEKGMSTPGPGTDKIDRAPLAIRDSLIFPYRAGLGFVAALRHHQPWRAVDAAYARPPRSTEQVLHPEKYLADEAPVPVALAAPAALPGFALSHATVWGELGFDLWLRSPGVADASAAQAMIAAHAEIETLAVADQKAIDALRKAGGASALLVPVPLQRDDVH
ncbi:MAG TPA: hypothetical protein VFP84_18445, partial [Kofleriaceae bacterium]|nr:hypothetical protein [Kofleriaceae bacterium]